MGKAQYISFSSGNSPLDCPCNYENIINSSANTRIKPRLKVYKAWRRHCKSIARIYEIHQLLPDVEYKYWRAEINTDLPDPVSPVITANNGWEPRVRIE